jgi:hypothetical protein
LKAITLHQPWATLIAIGAKKYETRSWTTWYRGPIAIHAGLSCEYLALVDREPFRKCLQSAGINDLPLGAIVAYARLIHVFKTMDSFELGPHELEFGNFALGRFAWQLANVEMLDEPIPMRGKQGLWDMPGYDAPVPSIRQLSLF